MYPSTDPAPGSLRDLGWNAFFDNQLGPQDAGLHPARVVSEHGERALVAGAFGQAAAVITGTLRRTADRTPAAGDWVLVRDGVIHRILEPRTALCRKEAGKRSATQVLAANVDLVVVVTAANRDLNPRRLERYLVAAARSGAQAVVVINKADLEPEIGPFIRLAAAVAGASPVYAISALDGGGLEPLQRRLAPGETAVLVGSSGGGQVHPGQPPGWRRGAAGARGAGRR